MTQETAAVLKALGSVQRLDLLQQLQRPRRLGDIVVESDGRPISRQAVRKHLNALISIGVVVQTDAGFLVHHARLFEVVESMRGLAVVRAEVEVKDVTQPLGGSGTLARPSGPHLLVVRGVREGAALRLLRDQETTLGRAAGPLWLDHDRFISKEQASVLWDNGFCLVASESSTNPTMLNGTPMRKGAIAPLESGDLIGMGLTLLVFRA